MAGPATARRRSDPGFVLDEGQVLTPDMLPTREQRVVDEQAERAARVPKVADATDDPGIVLTAEPRPPRTHSLAERIDTLEQRLDLIEQAGRP